MKKWLKDHRWHFAGWGIFILYEYLLVIVTLDFKAPLAAYVFHYILNISLFYLHAKVLSISLRQRKAWAAVLTLLVLSEAIIYTAGGYFGDYLLYPSAREKMADIHALDWKFIFSTLWRGIYFMLFSSAFYFLKDYMAQRELTAALEIDAAQKLLHQKQTLIELADARNANLKSQINPHFLFNTLTYIYNSTHKTEPRSAEAVSHLTKLMRYAIECEHGPELMPLEAEIRQVEHLLKLSRIKQTNLFVDFQYDEASVQTAIIPLVLLSLTENMVKHGNLSDRERPGLINISTAGQILEIRTRNLINTGLNDAGFHTGLNNINKRLLHSYGESAEISFGKVDGYFEVLVRILPAKAERDPLESSGTEPRETIFKEDQKN